MKKILSLILSVIMITALICFGTSESTISNDENTTDSIENYAEELASMKENLESLNETNSYSTDYIEEIPEKDGYVTDNAGLLTDEEKSALENKLAEIREETGFETAILTVNDPYCNENTIENYSALYFMNNFYGNGAVLVMSMYERDCFFRFFGNADGIGEYSDDWISETVLSHLSAGNYADGFNVFADITNEIYTNTEDPKIYRVFDWKMAIIISVASGLIIAFFVTMKFKDELKSVAMKANANDYTVPGSLNITASNEAFLYSNITRTAKPKNNSKGGGGSHGGGSHSGGGKF